MDLQDDIIYPLIQASKYGDTETVLKLLKKKKTDVNVKDDKGYTALIHASERGYKEIASMLIKKGADVNARNNDGDTALIYASGHRHIEILSMLLVKKADVNMARETGWTALMWASYNGYVNVVLMLLNNGANVNAKTEVGHTALHRACETGKYDIVSILLERGADVNAKNQYGNTGLTVATMSMNIHTQAETKLLVSILLDKGADVNAKNSNPIFDRTTGEIVRYQGNAPLGYACRHKSTEIVEMLLDAGADIVYKEDEKSDFLKSIVEKRNRIREINITSLVIKKGLTKNNEPLMQKAQSETIYHIASFF